MEIIDELETLRRGFYGGCVGYIDYSGNMDTAIAIRTLLVKDGQIFVRAGAGIVADSDPDAEFEETVNKGRALIEAIDMAREGGTRSRPGGAQVEASEDRMHASR